MQEIDAAFATLRTNMVFLNSNYDPSLRYPVTTFFDKRYQSGIDPFYKTRQVIDLQENQVLRQDSWYDTSFAATDPILFYTSVGMSPN